jgi:hypothetical protein
VRLNVRAAMTVSNIWLSVQTSGAGASSGSFVGLYSSAGTLLSGSSDVGAQFTAAAAQISCALTTPQAIAAGAFVWGAVLCNLATTQVSLGRATGIALLGNVGAAAAGARFAINGTVQATLPASITPASNNTNAPTLWMGAS